MNTVEVQPDVKTGAEPSAAPTSQEAKPQSPAFNAADQSTWSPEQREHWNRTGEQPVQPKKAESESAVSSAKKTEPEPDGKSAAESGAAKSQQEKPRKSGEKATAEERISQLTAENKVLEARLRALEIAPKSDTKPEGTPEAKKPELLKRPNPYTFKGTPAEFDEAMEKYEAQERQRAIVEYEQRRAQESAANEMKQQMAAARELYPDADTRIIPTVKAIFEDKQIGNGVRAMLEGSDVLVHLMYTLGDPAKLAEFQEKARTRPDLAIREIVLLEGLVKEELGKKKSSSAAKPENQSGESGSTKIPAEKPKPRAPEPPPDLGGRGSAPPDAAQQAAKDGNFRNFEAEMNRRLRASAKA